MTAIRVRAYFSPAEHRQLVNLANEAGISVSAFIRTASLNQKVPSVVDKEAVLALIQSKADLGRLGGLLKMALGKPAGAELPREEMRNLLKDLEHAQRFMGSSFEQVRKSLLQG